MDLYFGPTAPAGHEANWVQTIPGRHWFSYFRFYGPLEPYFDRSWKLGDIVPKLTRRSFRTGRGGMRLHPDRTGRTELLEGLFGGRSGRFGRCARQPVRPLLQVRRLLGAAAGAGGLGGAGAAASG